VAARAHAHGGGSIGGRNSPIILPTGAVECEELTKGHHGGGGH
jgi:hypothetical protein